MLTFSLFFKHVFVNANMWHGFHSIIYFNDCVLDLIPLALTYTILSVFWGNFGHVFVVGLSGWVASFLNFVFLHCFSCL